MFDFPTPCNYYYSSSCNYCCSNRNSIPFLFSIPIPIESFPSVSYSSLLLFLVFPTPSSTFPTTQCLYKFPPCEFPGTPFPFHFVFLSYLPSSLPLPLPPSLSPPNSSPNPLSPLEKENVFTPQVRNTYLYFLYYSYSYVLLRVWLFMHN